MPETDFSIVRATPRFTFVAEAEVTESPDGTRVTARISELSSRGCYIDTLNPFPIGKDLRFRIRYGCSTCELSGKVIYTHSGFGMGVLFGEIEGQQRAMLNSWLDELERKSK